MLTPFTTVSNMLQLALVPMVKHGPAFDVYVPPAIVTAPLLLLDTKIHAPYAVSFHALLVVMVTLVNVVAPLAFMCTIKPLFSSNVLFCTVVVPIMYIDVAEYDTWLS